MRYKLKSKSVFLCLGKQVLKHIWLEILGKGGKWTHFFLRHPFLKTGVLTTANSLSVLGHRPNFSLSLKEFSLRAPSSQRSTSRLYSWMQNKGSLHERNKQSGEKGLGLSCTMNGCNSPVLLSSMSLLPLHNLTQLLSAGAGQKALSVSPRLTTAWYKPMLGAFSQR